MAIDGNGHTPETLNRQLSFDVEVLQERISELELQLEDVNWRRVSFDGETEFSREGLKQICALSRIMYLKNPLIQRGVNVQRDYVFGQGVVIQAEDPDVDEVVQAFLDDAKNKVELTSHQAQLGKEVELAVEGNLFFVFFPNQATGKVRVRTIPTDEVSEIICNPNDYKDQWYYKREWSERTLRPETGLIEPVNKVAYYPDWRYTGPDKPGEIGGKPVYWNSPVYHTKVGGLPSMRFGVPETYAGLDWARAYKSFLEDWATIVRAYARFAWQVTTKTKAGVGAAKAKLASTVTSSAGETNPPPVTGSVFIGSEGQTVAPVRTAGATTSAEDGRRLLLMVAATMGLPESFFGDVSVGTLATAKSLDRPTELKIVSRQTLWEDILTGILDYVVVWAVKANVLKGTVEEADDGTPTVVLEIDPETKEPKSAAVRVEFPPVLEHDVNQSISAIVDAATLKGSAPANTMDAKTVSRMLLTALGVDDVEALLDILYPEDLYDPALIHEPEEIPDELAGDTGETPEGDDETPPKDGEIPEELAKDMKAMAESLGGLTSELRTLREIYVD